MIDQFEGVDTTIPSRDLETSQKRILLMLLKQGISIQDSSVMGRKMLAGARRIHHQEELPLLSSIPTMKSIFPS
uniref:Uncharacterized protein n=1 Tax=Solanum tuberosum TaxID=4113 RepID=M1BEI2_SOLTU